jgi:uncharacterized damage-inducible protein DinB
MTAATAQEMLADMAVRPEPAVDGDERSMLLGWLAYERATLARKCAGLSPDELRRRALPPSTLSLLGLVRHVAEVERGWFRRSIAGEEAPPLYYSEADPDGDFDGVDAADPDEDVATWRREWQQTDAVLREVASLDQPTARPRRNGATPPVRWVLVHMIEEYARHNGHADLLRQRIDGSVGE